MIMSATKTYTEMHAQVDLALRIYYAFKLFGIEQEKLLTDVTFSCDITQRNDLF